MISPGGLWEGTLWAEQMMLKAVEGDWLILEHAGRLRFRSRLVVTVAIVIDRDDGLSSTCLGHYSNAVLGFLANEDGASRLLGTCSMNPRGRIVGAFSLSDRQ